MGAWAVEKCVERVSKFGLTGNLSRIDPVFSGQNKSFCIDTPLNFAEHFVIMEDAKKRNFQKLPFFGPTAQYYVRSEIHVLL